MTEQDPTKIILTDVVADQRENGTEEKPLHRYAVACCYIRNAKDDKGRDISEWRHEMLQEDVQSENSEGAEWLADKMMRGDSQMPEGFILNSAVSRKLD